MQYASFSVILLSLLEQKRTTVKRKQILAIMRHCKKKSCNQKVLLNIAANS